MSPRSLVPALLAAVLAGCGPTGPRFVTDPQRYKGLPSDPVALVELADELTEERGRSPRRTDRALAALERALALGYPRPADVYWRRARAYFMMAEDLPNEHQQLGHARLGREAARKAVRLDGRRVESFYYLALNTAKVAEASTDMSLIKPMLELGETAARLDPSYDNGGPLRFLGKVYLMAPAWPVSVGSPEKAIEVLERAVEISPHPLNLLFLGQAYFHDEEYEDAVRLIRRALESGKSGGMAPRWQQEAQRYLQKACRKASGIPACSGASPGPTGVRLCGWRSRDPWRGVSHAA